MPRVHYKDGLPFATREAYIEHVAPFAKKFAWFHDNGYGKMGNKNDGKTPGPHIWQTVFHAQTNPDGRLCRFRHLVAGRRGGKTLSAAEEVLYYALHPEDFHMDFHGEDDDYPLHIWVLTKDHKVGRQPLLVFRRCLQNAGLEANKDYIENRSEMTFEFPNGTLIEFRTAVDPQSLRGPGLDMLWIDEAAFIPNQEAYDVISPALDDKLGAVICTTTPDGKNWYYDEFWSDEALQDPDMGRVEYRSLDNPYFPRSSWERRKLTYHPLLFKQEFEASFDSMVGRELPGEWLTKHFYTSEDLPKAGDKLDLDVYIGVDPAISLADTADRFVISAIGVTKSQDQIFLLEQYVDRIPFAEQLQAIHDFHLKYRPILIGVEATAYQAALAQQAMRMEGLPPIAPMKAIGKKFERILSMAPLFRVGRCRVRATERDFIDEWLNYDSTLKNPKDDCLDSMEIALRTAGALMPIDLIVPKDEPDRPHSLQELAHLDIPQQWNKFEDEYVDPHLGGEF